MRRLDAVTTYLDVVGIALVSLFLFVIWPPLVMLSLGGFALVASWRLTASRPAKDDRYEGI